MNQSATLHVITDAEFDIIKAARALRPAVPRDPVLAKLYEIEALLVDTERSNQIDPLAPPRIVFLDADGRPLPKGVSDGAVAFELPQYGRMFDIAVTKASNWQNAKEVAGSCRALGFTDWYLPDAKELELLVSRTRIQPATYPELVPFTRFDDWYWSSTEYPSGSSVAYFVHFSNGSVFWGNRSSDGLVRACRAVPASQ